MCLLGTFASQLGKQTFDEHFAAPLFDVGSKHENESRFFKIATDNCSLIRTDWAKTCAQIAQVDGFGQPWLTSVVLPMVLELDTYGHKNYLIRAVVDQFVIDCGSLLVGTGALEEKLLPMCISHVNESRVPNLRIQGCIALCAACRHKFVADSFCREKILPLMQTSQEKDEDMDVKALSAECLSLLS